MAVFAPVVPLQIARMLKQHGVLGRYHLLLAHDILLHPAEYQEVYGDIPDRHIILDNSIVELGAAMEMIDLMMAAEIIRPQYMVIPDVMGNAEATVDLARDFVNRVTAMSSWEWPLLAVIQGNSYVEACSCAQQLSWLQHVAALSVPRIIGDTLGTRMRVVQTVAQRYPDKMLHLLGFSEDILDDVACARVHGVKGIDSAVPIRLGLQGRDITLNIPCDPGPRLDYWDTPTASVEYTKWHIIGNLEQMRGWVQPRQGKFVKPDTDA